MTGKAKAATARELAWARVGPHRTKLSQLPWQLFSAGSHLLRIVLGVLKTNEKKGQHRREKGCGIQEEGEGGRAVRWTQPLLFWEKPAICWAPRDPSSPTCQLHTIEFLGTVAAMAPHAYRARQRAKARAVASEPHSAVDGHHSARRWGPRGPCVPVHPQPWPLPSLTDVSLGSSLRISPQMALAEAVTSPGGPAALRTDHPRGG